MEMNYQKKIEKISQAIYLVSNHLKDSEPLKWELRKEGIGFLSCIRSLNEEGDSNNLPADIVIDALTSYGRDLTSLILLAVVSGLISRSNGEIIMAEIELLLSSFRELVSVNTAKAGFVLSQEFFAADPELQDNLLNRMNKGQPNFLSDRPKFPPTERLPFGKNLQSTDPHKNKVSSTFPDQNPIKDKKDNRQIRIVELLKTRSNLTIKDFVYVINDCSEKTIQRELLDLVDKGIVKKEGERRWSTYSLK